MVNKFMEKYFLIKRIIIGIIIMIFMLLIIIDMWNGRAVLKSKKIVFVNYYIKIIYKRIIPVFMIFGFYYILGTPLLDYFDQNSANNIAFGTLTGFSSSRNSIGEYTISLDEKTYKLPKKLISYNALKIGNKYKIYYYKRSRIVYKIKI